MQIPSRFTIAVHILTATAYFRESRKVTSSFLAGSVGANPVIVRNIMGQLRDAGLIETRKGASGIDLAQPLEDMSLLDVYRAVECVDESGLFHMHEHPSAECPIGRVIHASMEGPLRSAQDALEAELSRTSVADVLHDAEERLAAASSTSTTTAWPTASRA